MPGLQGDLTMITCPSCGGQGTLQAMFPRYAEHVPQPDRKPCIEITCHTCGGTGNVTGEHAERIADGNELRKRRIAVRVGLRKFSEQTGLKASAVSGVEQGNDGLELVRRVMEHHLEELESEVLK